MHSPVYTQWCRSFNVAQGPLYLATRYCKIDAVTHMANGVTGLILLPLSSPNSMPTSLSFRTLGKRVRCLLATRLALPAISSARSSPKRSRSGESNLEVKRLARQRRRRQRRQPPRRPRRSVRRQRRPPAVIRRLRLLRRDRTDLHRRLQKRRYQGAWNRSASRHLSEVV